MRVCHAFSRGITPRHSDVTRCHKAGEMLRETERAEPRDCLLRGNTMQPRETPTLADLGVSKIQSYRWQQEASVPEGVT